MTSATIVGNLTKDMELRYTQGGLAIGAFTVATSRRVKKGGEWEDDVSYIDCTLFGKRADGLAQYLTKGVQVSVIGELVQERWKASDGSNRSTLKIIVERLELGRTGNNSISGRKWTGDTPPSSGREFEGPEFFEDDIPF